MFPDQKQALLGANVFPTAPIASRDSLPLLARRDTQDLVSSRQLEAWGVPYGLAATLEAEQQQVARRIFLLDNSGSTGTGDGHLVQEDDGIVTSLPCTRWEEIAHMAVEQARWNLCLGVPCEFVLLNPLGNADSEGVGFLVVDAARGAPLGQVQALEAWLKRNGPKGCTPLSERLQEIEARIVRQREQLADQAQRVCVIIATDGLPTTRFSGTTTDSDRRSLVRALRQLSNLHVHIVLRLCTDDDSVVEFYGQIDNEVEMSLEVLDDLASEAQELQANGNGWLTYSPLLHRVREGGCFVKVLDLLDERPLSPPEVYNVVSLLLAHSPEDRLPREPNAFCAEVERRVASGAFASVYDPLTKRQAPPVNVRALRRAMGISRWQRLKGCFKFLSFV